MVTIMGHVDHGKTTLLDYLRNSQIVKQEFGGITQHIGAFVVPFKRIVNDKPNIELVTFLDTPGHAAFAAMRQRGANVTDIVVLVVACDDGVLDQTIESIKYAQESQVPIIVAVNKIDKYENDPTELAKHIKQLRAQLVVHDVISELDGGEVQLVPISALKGTGTEDLKEAILALAETLELKSEVGCKVSGRIIESLVHPHKGKLCTVLVQKGVLQKGNFVISGYNWARVRALFDERNQNQQSCLPGMPIQVTGWREEDLPSPGDMILQVDSEAEAKKTIHRLKQDKSILKATEDAEAARKRYEEFYKIYKEKLIEKRTSYSNYGRIFFLGRGVRGRETEEEDPELLSRKINLILKCDVDGSLEAILDLLDTYDRDDKQLVKLDVMHHGVGSINESDLTLAASFPNTVIYGFNVKATSQDILNKAKREQVTIKFFNVIYHLIDDLKTRMNDKMPELEQEVDIGQAVVLQGFIINEKKKKIHVAGCRCNRGPLRNNHFYKLKRNNEMLQDGLQVQTLKHVKDDVKEIEKDRECGISFLNLNESIEFKSGDVLVSYEKQKYRPKLRWNLKGFD